MNHSEQFYLEKRRQQELLLSASARDARVRAVHEQMAAYYSRRLRGGRNGTLFLAVG